MTSSRPILTRHLCPFLDELWSNDNSSLAIVYVKLVGAENYKMWASAMKFALKRKNKMGFIDGRTTCTCDAKSGSAKYTQLIRLMQFLMGLNDVYQPIRSTILAKDHLPNVKDTFYVVSREESHRGLHPGSSGANKTQPAAFVVKTNNNTNNFNGRVNTNNNKNVNRGPNPNLTCTNFWLISHIVDRCYELIGYPAGFKRNPNLPKQSRNNNKRFNANSEVSQSVPITFGFLSSSFTNEQMMKLLSLINEKPSPSANNSDMFNVMDISSLMLTVSHLNGTIAKISAIGSLRLTSGIVLFHVLVVPEYNVSLLSVNKMIKDRTDSEFGALYLFDIDKIGEYVSAMCNYVFVCHVSSELWHYRLGHPADQVLSILGKKLGFSKKDHISHGDICHKAKKTMEPFPLSDHKSNFVGDIIHCDVWGPYRVVSKDGYKFFLTFVDDFSKAVWINTLNETSNDFDKNNKHVNGLCDSEENNLNFFDVQSPERPNDEEDDSSNVEGNTCVGP
ncbi:ribonuclease H-like domain-containing protein [Tanacetum coccineum]